MTDVTSDFSLYNTTPMAKCKIILVRGVPGSGKSTLAKMFASMYSNSLHMEADMYFCRRGEYKFDPERLGHSHGYCRHNSREFLETNWDREDSALIVSNTFTRLSEMYYYFDLAAQFGGIRPTIYLAQGNFQNIHGVSPEKVQMMRERFEYDTLPLYKMYGFVK